MGQRSDLHTLLLGCGTTHVYFQPPSTLQMTYPCIVYKRSGLDRDFANNEVYQDKTRYSITVIDSNPDSLIPRAVSLLPATSFNQFFVADNLNHDVYSIVY